MKKLSQLKSLWWPLTWLTWVHLLQAEWRPAAVNAGGHLLDHSKSHLASAVELPVLGRRRTSWEDLLLGVSPPPRPNREHFL